MQVIAQDVSQGQLDEAIKNSTMPNIQFSLAKAEDTGVASSSVDLVTVAQALHWCATHHAQVCHMPDGPESMTHVPT
jgi:ubiquinone/menaquinone biosynthesis C-methylase UbiE